MDKKIFFNGSLYPEKTKLISVLDRGLCFGDSIFEVIRCIDGKFLLFSKHLNRMTEAADILKIKFPYSEDELLFAAKKLVQYNNVFDGELYLQLTRGEALRYHNFPDNIKPNFFMVLNNIRKIKDTFRKNGASVCTFPDLRGGLCELKTTNLLANVLGKEEAKKNGDYEALFIREDNYGKYITEGPSSSYFGIYKNKLLTPEIVNVLPGTTRNAIIKIARDNNFEVVEKKIYLNEYIKMDEAFLTSTVSKVMPVVKINNNNISDSKPGKMTLFIQRLYEEYISNNLE